MNSSHRLRELDSLRGIAALSVLVFHLYLISQKKYPGLDFLNLGATGVDLFFMISGFVIFMSISNSNNFKHFWMSRIIRLFPTYWLSILVALVVSSLFSTINFQRSWNFIFGNILMLQPIFKTSTLLGSYWTLYVELCFYAMISILYQFKLLNKIEMIIWLGLLVMLVINVGYIDHQHSEGYTRFFIITRALFPQISYFCFFAAGILYYLIYTSGFTTNRIISLCACLLMTLIIHDSGRFNLFFDSVHRLMCVTAYYVLFTLVVSRYAGFLKFKWLYFFGVISYSLYLVHEPVGFALYKYLVRYIDSIFATILSAAASIFLAIIITYSFERPLLKKLKKLNK